MTDILTLELPSVPSRPIECYHPCNACKGLAPPEHRTCGRCPQRRATDTEINDSQERGEELPLCRRETCRRPLKCSTTNPPRFLDTEPGVLCYECYKESTKHAVKCQCPKHRGPVHVAVEITDKFALRSSAKRTEGDIHFATVCYACALRYSLQTRAEWLFEHGDYDPSTGEVIPAIQQTGPLIMESDPFALMGPVWQPTEATYLRDGNTYTHEAIVDPIRYLYWRRGNRPCRALVCDYKADGSKALTRGVVWLPSLNAECDRLTELGDRRKRSPVYSVGLLYVRCVARATESIGAYVVQRSKHPDLSDAEWLQYCRETGQE